MMGGPLTGISGEELLSCPAAGARELTAPWRQNWQVCGRESAAVPVIRSADLD
jgi:hypothetical protein